MTIEVQLHGRRYIEDRDTAAVLAGSQSRATMFTERWTFALDGDSHQPWLMASASASASASAGNGAALPQA
jgi:predicted lipid-binding transport protein (Tim44 family)